MSVNADEIVASRSRIGSHIVRTPCSASRTLSVQLGCELFIKFENLQFTASFKERGALNCLLCKESEVSQGVIAMSAGNHAQALAYHGTRMGLPTTIVMPRTTPNAKVEATRQLGAEVILHGVQFDETLKYTQQLAEQRGLYLVHPFDDEDVIAGQGTVALEVLEQVPDVDCIVVPIGGGGLIGGIACAIKSANPQIEIIGVQAERFANAQRQFDGLELRHEVGPSSVAEGIAVKQPGLLTSKLIERYVDEVHTVSELQIEQAVFDLLEIEKTVAEGAGAAALALVRAQPEKFAGKKVVMILSGGNVDMMILSSLLQRGLVRSHRLVRLQIEIPDTPGALGNLTVLLGELESNIVEINHQRTFGASSVRATMVELVLQMRGEEQEDTVTRALHNAGYEIHRLD